MRRLLLTLPLALVPACEEETIQPESGPWTYVEGETFDDTCGYADAPTSPMGTFTIANPGGGTFTVTAGADPPFACTLSGSRFSCPDRLDNEIPLSGLDAVVHIHVGAFGTFSSSRAAAGYQRADASCSGADCDVAAAVAGVTWPCAFSVRFTATFAGDR
jgi:hypothetical protein